MRSGAGGGSDPELHARPVRRFRPRLPLAPWYAFWHFLSRIGAILLFDCRCRFTRDVPGIERTIFASNHQSFLDPWVVGLCLPGQLSYLARDSLFRFPVFGAVLRSLNAIPVARESQAPRQAIDVCVEALAEGRGLVLFPEGTRTRDGSMGPLKRGLALIARRSGATVVPVLVDGAFEAWPKDRLLPRPGVPISVYFGAPIRGLSGEYDGKKTTPSEKRSGESDRHVQDRQFHRTSSGPGESTLPLSGGARGPGETAAGSGSNAETGGPEPGVRSPPVGPPPTRESSESSSRRSSRSSSAALLEELGEAYRVLQVEAGKRRQVPAEEAFRPVS